VVREIQLIPVNLQVLAPQQDLVVLVVLQFLRHHLFLGFLACHQLHSFQPLLSFLGFREDLHHLGHPWVPSVQCFLLVLVLQLVHLDLKVLHFQLVQQYLLVLFLQLLQYLQVRLGLLQLQLVPVLLPLLLLL